jgi:hypothetical protein
VTRNPLLQHKVANQHQRDTGIAQFNRLGDTAHTVYIFGVLA